MTNKEYDTIKELLERVGSVEEELSGIIKYLTKSEENSVSVFSGIILESAEKMMSKKRYDKLIDELYFK